MAFGDEPKGSDPGDVALLQKYMDIRRSGKVPSVETAKRVEELLSADSLEDVIAEHREYLDYYIGAAAWKRDLAASQFIARNLHEPTPLEAERLQAAVFVSSFLWLDVPTEKATPSAETLGSGYAARSQQWAKGLLKALHRQDDIALEEEEAWRFQLLYLKDYDAVPSELHAELGQEIIRFICENSSNDRPMTAFAAMLLGVMRDSEDLPVQATGCLLELSKMSSSALRGGAKLLTYALYPGVRDSVVEDLLGLALASDDDETAALLSIGLHRIGKPRAIDPLVRILARHPSGMTPEVINAFLTDLTGIPTVPGAPQTASWWKEKIGDR